MGKFVNTKEASVYLCKRGVPFTPGTLEVMRCQGRGPEYRKVNRRVFYTVEALDAFMCGDTVKTVDSMEVS